MAQERRRFQAFRQLLSGEATSPKIGRTLRRVELAIKAKADNRAADVAEIVADLKASGAVSLRQIAAGLNERGIPIARGGAWSAVQVQRITTNPQKKT